MSKLLVWRLELYLSALNKSDQTSLIRSRFSHNNVRLWFNVTYNTGLKRLLSNAAKAFKGVKSSIVDVLQRFGPEMKFIQSVRLIYSAPRQVRLGKLCLEGLEVGLHNCPLSHVLFASSLKPLANHFTGGRTRLYMPMM